METVVAAKRIQKKTPKPDSFDWLQARKVVSVLLAVTWAFLYFFRPYITEAITIWPSWVWIVPGVCIAFTFDKNQLWKVIKPALVAWMTVGLLFSEVWRVVIPAATPQEDSVRVVTLNVAGLMKEALIEVAQSNPDVVFIQESGGVAKFDELVKDTFGEQFDSAEGDDCSVLVRGSVISDIREEMNHTIVHARLESGRSVMLVSLRMQPPSGRMDFWRTSFWPHYGDHRINHIKEMEEIWASVESHRIGTPMILGGDFNAVPDGEITHVFNGTLEDSFKNAGSGWYGTALNSYPFFRIDQVWSSKQLRAIGSRAKKSEVSDHRMVVADFIWSGD